MRARFPLFLGVLGLCLFACAHNPKPGEPTTINPAPHEVVPDDWMVVRLEKGGPQEVINRQQYQELRAKGIHPKTPSSLQRKPPYLLTAPLPVRLRVGQVRTFMLEDAPIQRITISGGNAEAYWSKPYLIHRRETTGVVTEHQGSDFHLRGLGTGPSTLEIEFSNGAPKQVIPIEVGPAGKSVG